MVIHPTTHTHTHLLWWINTSHIIYYSFLARSVLKIMLMMHAILHLSPTHNAICRITPICTRTLVVALPPPNRTTVSIVYSLAAGPRSWYSLKWIIHEGHTRRVRILCKVLNRGEDDALPKRASRIIVEIYGPWASINAESWSNEGDSIRIL